MFIFLSPACTDMADFPISPTASWTMKLGAC